MKGRLMMPAAGAMDIVKAATFMKGRRGFTRGRFIEAAGVATAIKKTAATVKPRRIDHRGNGLRGPASVRIIATMKRRDVILALPIA
jgi:hypothetical protein